MGNDVIVTPFPTKLMDFPLAATNVRSSVAVIELSFIVMLSINTPWS